MNANPVPSVTVLIPARNEEADIERCLRAVLAQDHPRERIEVIVVDGGSDDRTAEIARQILGENGVDWKVLENAIGTTPSNLNAGLSLAIGDLLCRVDARSIVPREYVRLCAEVLSTRPEVVITGGAQVAIPLTNSAMSLGIARALNNKYTMGGSRYRSGSSSGPSDTVYLGAFRTADLRAAGGWDEYFETNQDYELSRRMARRGVVWFDARLKVSYIPRQSLAALWCQYHRFGRWKVRYWRRTGNRPQRRQLVPICGVPLVIVVALAGLRRPQTLPPLAGLALAAAAGVDTLGSPERGVSTAPRLVGLAVTGATGLGWVSGVWRQAIHREGER